MDQAKLEKGNQLRKEIVEIREMVRRWQNIDAEALSVNYKNNPVTAGIPVTNEFIETLLTYWEFVAQQKETEFGEL